MDINRTNADQPDVLKTRTVRGFTTVTSEPVYNEVDDNADRQYTFYDAYGHVMGSLIADICDLSLRKVAVRLGAHTSASSGGPG